MAGVYHLKEDTCENVMNCFKYILENYGVKPEHLIQIEYQKLYGKIS